jgi:hypothetical protein
MMCRLRIFVGIHPIGLVEHSLSLVIVEFASSNLPIRNHYVAGVLEAFGSFCFCFFRYG